MRNGKRATDKRLDAAEDAYLMEPRLRGMDKSAPMRSAIAASDAVLFSDESVEKASQSVHDFLNLNYPCGCAKGEMCAGNADEARSIVFLVWTTLKGASE